MKKKLLILPVILYSIFLIICPLIYILILSFLKSDSYGGVIFTLTLENYKELFDFVYIIGEPKRLFSRRENTL